MCLVPMNVKVVLLRAPPQVNNGCRSIPVQRRVRIFLFLTASSFSHVLRIPHCPPKLLPKMALQRELSRIVQAGTSATVGIAVSALTSGAGALALPPPLGLNTTELFPMASTFKVPLACVVLRMVDAGELQLTDMIQLGLRDVRPGTGVLTLKLLENQGSPGVVGLGGVGSGGTPACADPAPATAHRALRRPEFIMQPVETTSGMWGKWPDGFKLAFFSE